MTRWILLGAFAFVGLTIALAPAHVATTMAREASNDRIVVSAADGSLWMGSGYITLRLAENLPAVPLGKLSWRLFPSGLDAVTIDWTLSDTSHRLDGRLAVGASDNAFMLDVDGRLESAFINPFLAPYYITLDGRFDIEGVSAEVKGRDIRTLTGRLRFSGGEVVYRLSGETHTIVVEPMIARANETPEGLSIVASTAESETTMMQARLDDAGWLHVGITRAFLESVGQRWRGDDPPEAMVLEVSEKIL